MADSITSTLHNTTTQLDTASYPHKNTSTFVYTYGVPYSLDKCLNSPDKCLVLADSITSTLHNATTQLDTCTLLGTATQPDTAR